jgi:hypothetical protein
MKKAILGMAGSLLLSVAVVQAQDSTRTASPRIQPPSSTKPQSQYPQPQLPYSQPQIQPQPNQNQIPQTPSQYRRDDMKVIPQDQLPESLRQTLRGTQYQGWEQSTIYQDPATGEYLLDISIPTVTPNNTNPNATQNRSENPARTYRFDRYGKVIKDQNKTGIE